MNGELSAYDGRISAATLTVAWTIGLVMLASTGGPVWVAMIVWVAVCTVALPTIIHVFRPNAKGGIR